MSRMYHLNVPLSDTFDPIDILNCEVKDRHKKYPKVYIYALQISERSILYKLSIGLSRFGPSATARKKRMAKSQQLNE